MLTSSQQMPIIKKHGNQNSPCLLKPGFNFYLQYIITLGSINFLLKCLPPPPLQFKLMIDHCSIIIVSNYLPTQIPSISSSNNDPNILDPMLQISPCHYECTMITSLYFLKMIYFLLLKNAGFQHHGTCFYFNYLKNGYLKFSTIVSQCYTDQTGKFKYIQTLAENDTNMQTAKIN